MKFRLRRTIRSIAVPFGIAATICMILASATGCRGRGSRSNSSDDEASILDEDDRRPAREVLSRLGAHTSDEPRFDYGRDTETRGPVLEVHPEDERQVRRVVRAANRARMPIRVRGRGHSMNGSSLARAEELSLRTDRLRTLCRTGPTTVSLESGVAVVLADRFLARFGLALPVVNDGPLGPSVGGYVSAGGFGGRSPAEGGFWSQVRSIHLVDGTGAVRVIASTDPMFPWLFGSVGQLGAVVSAELNVVPREVADGIETDVPGRPDEFPAGVCHEIPLVPAQEEESFRSIRSWWTVIVTPDRADAAARALDAIASRHREGVVWLPPYRYPIAHRGVHAPLVTPTDGDVIAVGIWSAIDVDRYTEVREDVAAVEREVHAMARASGYRRYLAAERMTGPSAWRDNLGEATYARFRAIKAEFDPDQLFGRGSVFAPAVRR